MYVKVPGELHGASLLKAHNWVKSHAARSNPGGSADYKLFNAKGEQVTLSDITKNPNSSVMIEVTKLEGVKNNPSSMTPIPMMEFDYPEMPRSGNSLTELLPCEIDSALATRIVGEQGLNRGLHTLNRLLHEPVEVRPASSTTAALIQMSEAIRGKPLRNNPRRNPRTPFTQRAPNFYNSEMALQTWVQDELGAEIRAEDTAPGIVGKAKIAARYGLNKMDIHKFATDVLADYLFAASANRGLLRALMERLPDLKDDRETVQKLVSMFPMQPKAFYNGTKRCFVAHALFMYPRLAASSLTPQMADGIVATARNYPDNITNNGRLPRTISPFVMGGTLSTRSIPEYFWDLIRRSSGTTPGNAMDESLEKLFHSEGYWGTIVELLTENMEDEMRIYGRTPLMYFEDIGGFYPSPPPKWPTALMFAIMDTFLENLPHLLNTEGDIASSVLSPIGITETLIETALAGRMDDKNLPPQVTIEYEKKKVTLMKSEYKQFFSGKHLLVGQVRDMGLNVPKSVKWGSREEQRLILELIIEEIDSRSSEKTSTKEVTFDTAGPKSLLEMAYEVSTTAKDKYRYTMVGDDFSFVMAIMTVSLNRLNQEADNDGFNVSSPEEIIRKGLSDFSNRYMGTDLGEMERRLGEISDANIKEDFGVSIEMFRVLDIINEELNSVLEAMNVAHRTESESPYNQAIGQIVAETKAVKASEWPQVMKDIVVAQLGLVRETLKSRHDELQVEAAA